MLLFHMTCAACGSKGPSATELLPHQRGVPPDAWFTVRNAGITIIFCSIPCVVDYLSRIAVENAQPGLEADKVP